MCACVCSLVCVHWLQVMSTEPNQPSFVHSTLEELGIGTYANIATASPDTPIIVALNMFHEKRVSALPIVDASGKGDVQLSR